MLLMLNQYQEMQQMLSISFKNESVFESHNCETKKLSSVNFECFLCFKSFTLGLNTKKQPFVRI